MRADSIGLFWQDFARKKGDKVSRIMPPIPETGWVCPQEFPNLSRAKVLAIDTETYDPELKQHGPGWARGKGHICGLAVGTEDGGRWYFPMRHTIEKDQNLDPNHVLAWARDTFADPDQPKVGANIIYDIGWLREEGVRVEGALFDVQYAEALLAEHLQVNLDDLGERYLGRGKETNLLYDWCAQYYGGRSSEDQRKNIYRAPPRLVGPYAEGDVDLPLHIIGPQWARLVREGLIDLFLMECELIPLMVEMRFAGVTVDLPWFEELRERMLREEAELEKELHAYIGFDVNVNASESLARAFDSLGLSYGRSKTNKPSFTATVLDSTDHPFAQKVKQLKARKKLRGTFIESYVLNSHVNGRLYGQFHTLRGDTTGTRSGRLSSSNPNLQNIPSRTELGKLIRKGFIPDPGHRRWIKSDYSQVEYRGLAHYAVGPGSEEVRAKYNADAKTDFHRMVHDIVLLATGQDIERPYIKNLNFGTVYGMGKSKMGRQLGIAQALADHLYETLHNAAPFMRKTMDATMDEAQRLGYITTILGRRSRFELWVPGDWNDAKKVKPLPYEQAILRYERPRRAYLHKALNRRLQGSAADLMKMAMLLCWKQGLFHETGVPRLTVHDELDFSDPGGKDEAFKEIQHVMETAIQFSVPILVETEYGPNWGQVKKAA